ncbi:rRNA 2'-O-methyltransferase fibrillarin-like isoform X3 [Aquila chrysaetos chrysaetos]|uniref:rRNA 2'-O-methyltransferase fibrillarin-like isoform X3 n=1 Tax=Aquila chrysaetos chrysaetos TaxID=223781 RepID=UPI001176F846|nr:rRNA 2'-O-methyltransferase fibrillarin-like isoform X3 [Aquila chrysaetos chrysaetos]
MAEERGAELGAAPKRRREPVCRQRRSVRSAARRGRWQPSWGAATAPRRGGAAAEGGGARGSGVCRRGGGGGEAAHAGTEGEVGGGGGQQAWRARRARLHGGGGRQQRGGSGVRRGCCGGARRGPRRGQRYRTLRGRGAGNRLDPGDPRRSCTDPLGVKTTWELQPITETPWVPHYLGD